MTIYDSTRIPWRLGVDLTWLERASATWSDLSEICEKLAKNSVRDIDVLFLRRAWLISPGSWQGRLAENYREHVHVLCDGYNGLAIVGGLLRLLADLVRARLWTELDLHERRLRAGFADLRRQCVKVTEREGITEFAHEETEQAAVDALLQAARVSHEAANEMLSGVASALNEIRDGLRRIAGHWRAGGDRANLPPSDSPEHTLEIWPDLVRYHAVRVRGRGRKLKTDADRNARHLLPLPRTEPLGNLAAAPDAERAIGAAHEAALDAIAQMANEFDRDADWLLGVANAFAAIDHHRRW